MKEQGAVVLEKSEVRLGTNLLVATAFTLMAGVAASHFIPGLSGMEGAKQSLLMAGTGWVIQMLLALAFMRVPPMEYVDLIGKIMRTGVLILSPMIVWGFLEGPVWPAIPVLNVAASFGYMLYKHVTESREAGISFGWTISWMVSLWLGAGIWMLAFYVL